MYLKSLHIHGFKSFPTSVTLEFNKGITSVVGPNGSGKSNVSDAIRWVLGEQSAKNLRGAKMEDVIFFGTANRKSVGYCEVTMVLDNSDKKINLDFSEIRITRRQTRSGESTYQINGVNSRLKDIQELFMDTGIGKEGYSIIGQGRIEEILKAKSDERRLLFEEATGIVKYKKRRTEAFAKLEKQKENLIRVNDILKELEVQVGPLKSQSDKAKQYLALYETKKTHQIAIFVSDIKDKETTEQNYITSINNYKINIEEKQKEYNQIEATLVTLKEQQEDLKTQLKQLQVDFSSSKDYHISLNHEIDLNQEKIHSIDENIARLETELNAKKLEIEQKEAEIKEEESNITLVRERYNILQSELKQKEAELHLLQKNLGDNDQTLKDYNNKILLNAEEIAKLQNKISNEEELYENLNLETDNIIDEIKGLEYEINSLKEEVIVYEQDVKNSSIDLEKLKNDIKEFDQFVKDIKEEQLLISRKKNEISQLYHQKNATFKALDDAQKSHMGYYDSVKYVLNGVDQKDHRFNGVLGTVGDIFTTKKEYELALEITLASQIQNIITDNETTAKNIISVLRDENKGRCTFLPLNTVRTYNDTDVSFLKENGVIGFFKDLVDYDKLFEPIANSLLQKTLVIDTLDNAVSFNKKHKNKIKIVTLDGDVLSTTGSMTGGSQKKSTSSIFTNKRLLSDAEADVKKLKIELDKILDQEQKIEEKSDYYRDELSFARTSFADKQQFSSESSQLFETTKLKLNFKQDELAKIKNKDKDLLNQITQKNIDIKAFYVTLSQLNLTKKTLLEELDNFTKNLDEHKGKKDLEQNILMDINVKLTRERELENNHSQNIQRLKNIILTLDRDITNLTSSKNNDLGAKVALLNEIDEKIKKKNTIGATNEELIKTISLKENALNECSKSQEKLERTNKDLFIQINELSKALDKDEMYLENVSNEIKKLYDDVWNEYELTYQMCLEYPPLDIPLNEIKKIYQDALRQIKQLGQVNVLAIEQYMEVSERYEFLLTQREDIVEGEKKLNVVIAELTTLMEEQFNEQFAIIKQNFQEVFKNMFGGGNADLVLTEVDDPLSSPIEILAEPPGKKLKNLMLMSGGEKSLTAICLLFGILQMKPSPFCVLDEIEAALDDANVDRYAHFLSEFKEDTQFILITHRKGTMVIADTLYGVTMEEMGISKLISVKLEDYTD